MDSNNMLAEKKNKGEGSNDSNTDSCLGILDSQDIDDQELKTMKGDIVGNSVYSGSWIINTLMTLSKVSEVDWSEDMENRFCMLWDMTAEQDVILYLMENNFLEIAKYTLNTSTEPRLTEIILGIIGNICCNADVTDSIGKDKDFVTTILAYLRSHDTESLTQLLRLLKAVVWRIQQNPQSDWLIHLKECEFLGDSIIFILMSSTNDELLKAAIYFLQAISRIDLMYPEFVEKLFKINDLISALIESFKQFIPENSNNYSQVEMEFIINWLTILVNIMKFILRLDIHKNDANYPLLLELILRILKPYKQRHNLIPIMEKSALLIHESVFITLYFQRNTVYITSELNKIIAIIIFSLKTALNEEPKTEEIDPDEVIPELLDNLNKYWLEIIGLCTKEQITEMLCLCKCDIATYLVELAQSDSELSCDKLGKIQQAVSCVRQS